MVKIEEYHSSSDEEEEQTIDVEKQEQGYDGGGRSDQRNKGSKQSTVETTTRSSGSETATTTTVENTQQQKQKLPNSSNNQEALSRNCDGCGLPPRIQVDNDDPVVIPLKRCSICQQAWYHDRTCQQRHFPQHKKVCQRLKKHRQQQKEEESAALGVVEERFNKGRCVFAQQELPFGTVVGPCHTHNNKQDDDTKQKQIDKNTKKNSNLQHWQPTVPPVLLENHRKYRCVVCFGILQNNHNTRNDNPKNALNYGGHSSLLQELYPTSTCSDVCQRVSVSFVPAECEAIAKMKRDGMCPPVILPTAILLYRLLRAVEKDKGGQIRSILSQLQSERDHPTNSAGGQQSELEQEQEQAHTQAVTATTWAMMRASTLPLWKLEDVDALLRQVKLNGFSVCTAESVALGIGMYTAVNNSTPISSSNTTTTPSTMAPNWINHDCRPNLLQTFDYGVVGQFPSLRLTVCTPGAVQVGEELTIAYMDVSMPRQLRQDQLLQNYGFVCHCETCRSDGAEEGKDEGLKCPQKGCHGILIMNPESDSVENGKGMECSTCMAKLSPDQAAKRREELLHFQAIDGGNISALEDACRFLQKKCVVSSWYVRESHDRLLQALLDALGSTEDLQQQYSIAQRAFQLADTLLAQLSSNRQGEGCFALRRVILHYKSIKLRLFLNIFPEQAMQELEHTVLPTCATFFPNHHEIMREIVQDACL